MSNELVQSAVAPYFRGRAPYTRAEMKDRISTLPNNIIELILTCLPIAEAVRTSILSSRWRYQWCTIPHLIFDMNAAVSPYFRIDDAVDQVLFLHNGPIHKFVFHAYSERINHAIVDRWIVFLSRKNVKELSLRFSSADGYSLPTALYSCQDMVSLDLHECHIQIFSRFKGFSSLTSLFLKNISITEFDFTYLISKCPVLRKVVFIQFHERCHLNFNAPRLQELVVEGADIYLENTPDLDTLSLQLEDEQFYNADRLENGECLFTKCLGNIPKIKRLNFRQNCLDFLTRGDSFLQFPTYRYLKKVFLGCFNFEDRKHVIALQSLLRNTPVLKLLEIEAYSDKFSANLPTASFIDKKEYPTFSLERLQSVKVTKLMGVRSEMEFIEFILSAASALKLFTLKRSCCSEEQDLLRLRPQASNEINFYKKILLFRRASAQAEIAILD